MIQTDFALKTCLWLLRGEWMLGTHPLRVFSIQQRKRDTNLWEELPCGGMCKALWGHRAKKNPFSLGGIREGFVKVGNGCWSAPREGEGRTGAEDRGRSPSSSGVHELGARLPRVPIPATPMSVCLFQSQLYGRTQLNLLFCVPGSSS